ncbi:MAG: aldo/keto reductase [Betaproteobacteria bacterium]|nr:aldo/keto reductase [Betaproteobacteria bacterium]
MHTIAASPQLEVEIQPIPRVARRTVLKAGAGLVALTWTGLASAQAAGPVLTRLIPRTKEPLAVIGLGTAIIFDIGQDTAKRAEPTQVIRTLLNGGARLIDTAPSYGTAESVVGDLLANMKVRDKVFLATKVRADNNDVFVQQMKTSQTRLRSGKFDLMQMHNVGFLDRKQFSSQLAIVRDWKAQGVFRYIGVTHSQDQSRANERLIEMLRMDALDFIQVNYSMAERSVEDELLAVAAETGTAVLCNLPFARGALFRAVAGKAVPEWANAEFAAPTWGQFFLKYLLAHPSINAVLPGTDKPEYMIDNLAAARTRLPTAAQRRRMVDFIGTV